MRVVRIREFGPAGVLRVEAASSPSPGQAAVLIEVEVAGVSFGDTIVRSGRYPVPLPYVPGAEVGGRVVASADPELVGRRVVATTVDSRGGYAEFALARDVYPVPEGLGLAEAVAVFQPGALGVGLLGAMGVSASDTVLITAAAGRIGSVLVQLAKAAGARVIAAAGGPAKLAWAAALGADETVDYRVDGWASGITTSVVLDAVGGSIGEQAMGTLGVGGRLGIYGYSSGCWLPLEAQRIGRQGLIVMGPLGIVFAKPVAEQRADAEHALTEAANGRLTPRIHARYPLADAAAAHQDLEQRRNLGAVLLTAFEG